MSTYSDLCCLLDDDVGVRLRAIAQCDDRAALYALRMVLFSDNNANVRAAAATQIRKLGAQSPDLVARWLTLALDDDAPIVREKNIRALAHVGNQQIVERLSKILSTDPQWHVRRAAVAAIASIAGASSIPILRRSLDDPAWRVRLSVVHALALLAHDHELKDEILRPIETTNIVVFSAFEYLKSILNRDETIFRTLNRGVEIKDSCDDPDPAVVTANIDRAKPKQIPTRHLLKYIIDPHKPLRTRALRLLNKRINREILRSVLFQASDPRTPYGRYALSYFCKHNPELSRQIANEILGESSAPDLIDWAEQIIAQKVVDKSIDSSLLMENDKEDPLYRMANMSINDADVALSADVDPWVRRFALSQLLSDPNRRTVAAQKALTLSDFWCRKQGIEAIDIRDANGVLCCLSAVCDPSIVVRSIAREKLNTIDTNTLFDMFNNKEATVETKYGAWVYLLSSDRMDFQQTQLMVTQEQNEAFRERIATIIEPLESDRFQTVSSEELVAIEPPSVTQTTRSIDSRIRPIESVELIRRKLGRIPTLVSPMGISGANQLPERTLSRCSEMGCNLFFWEPQYTEMTKFLRAHSSSNHVVVAGTYHADKRSIIRDVERALRKLKRDYIDAFLLFWVRSNARLSTEALEAFESLNKAGKIISYGFSTHHRELAKAAIETGQWGIIMVRHNAAHRGAENDLLPTAIQKNVGVLSFSALCYGRLLNAVPLSTTQILTPTQAYLYSMTRTGIAATWSAPKNEQEAIENLNTLSLLPHTYQTIDRIDNFDIDLIKAHGDAVYGANQRFNALLRQAPTTSRKTTRSMALEMFEYTEQHNDDSSTWVSQYADR